MPIVAAVFDAFGTVVQIKREHHPFRQVLREGARQGLRASASDLHKLMTTAFSLEAAAEYFGISVSADRMQALQDDLAEEVASITVYTDAIDALCLLKSEGVSIGICSNLAQPYGPVVRQLLPKVDGFALSYEVGVMKPHADIYRAICHQLVVRPSWYMTVAGDKVVMIGDSVACDRDGPRVIGISGY